MLMSRTPNFSINNDNNPANYCVIFYIFGNLAHVNFVVGCYVLSLLLGKLQSVSIYQNTVGFLVHLAIAIYNSKILGEFLPFCACVLCQVKASFIAKVFHALRSLIFQS